MDKKWSFLFIAGLLFACCFTSADSNNAIGDNTISNKVDVISMQPEWTRELSSSEDVTSTNRTVTLKNPTFQEMKDFILKDTTSRKQFILNKYECRHFAADVNNNAEAAGIRCALVLLCYSNGQHAVVAFETTDRGLIYIEPQTDEAIRPEVGGTYQGEKILEIIIIW